MKPKQLSLIEQAKAAAKQLIDLLDQIEHRESEMSESSTARLENIRDAKRSATDTLEAVELL